MHLDNILERRRKRSIHIGLIRMRFHAEHARKFQAWVQWCMNACQEQNLHQQVKLEQEISRKNKHIVNQDKMNEETVSALVCCTKMDFFVIYTCNE